MHPQNITEARQVVSQSSSWPRQSGRKRSSGFLQKEENGICTLLWPPQSPDLNIIKNVWKVLKIQVQKRRKRNKECRWLETCCSGYLDRFGFALHTEYELYRGYLCCCIEHNDLILSSLYHIHIFSQCNVVQTLASNEFAKWRRYKHFIIETDNSIFHYSLHRLHR
jgi:hypothetical protein